MVAARVIMSVSNPELERLINRATAGVKQAVAERENADREAGVKENPKPLPEPQYVYSSSSDDGIAEPAVADTKKIENGAGHAKGENKSGKGRRKLQRNLNSDSDTDTSSDGDDAAGPAQPFVTPSSEIKRKRLIGKPNESSSSSDDDEEAGQTPNGKAKQQKRNTGKQGKATDLTPDERALAEQIKKAYETFYSRPYQASVKEDIIRFGQDPGPAGVTYWPQNEDGVWADIANFYLAVKNGKFKTTPSQKHYKAWL